MSERGSWRWGPEGPGDLVAVGAGIEVEVEAVEEGSEVSVAVILRSGVATMSPGATVFVRVLSGFVEGLVRTD